jgi:hypothetical protein
MWAIAALALVLVSARLIRVLKHPAPEGRAAELAQSIPG